jgi:hypothetical protein
MLAMTAARADGPPDFLGAPISQQPSFSLSGEIISALERQGIKD